MAEVIDARHMLQMEAAMEQEQQIMTEVKKACSKSLRWAIFVLRFSVALAVFFAVTLILIGYRTQGDWLLRHPGQPTGFPDSWLWYAGMLRFVGPFVAAAVVWLVVVELVVRGLRHGLRWAWVTALVISFLLMFQGLFLYCIPTVIGGVAIWYLMQPETAELYNRRTIPMVDKSKEESR